VKPHKPEQKQKCFGFKLILFLHANLYCYTTTTINPDQNLRTFYNPYLDYTEERGASERLKIGLYTEVQVHAH
jgi:hypothetical protein